MALNVNIIGRDSEGNLRALKVNSEGNLEISDSLGWGELLQGISDKTGILVDNSGKLDILVANSGKLDILTNIFDKLDILTDNSGKLDTLINNSGKLDTLADISDKINILTDISDKIDILVSGTKPVIYISRLEDRPSATEVEIGQFVILTDEELSTWVSDGVNWVEVL